MAGPGPRAVSKPKAFSYSTVSCALQIRGGGLERQVVMARAWCAAHGYELDEELELADPGVSAFKGDQLVSDGGHGDFSGRWRHPAS